GVGGLGSSTYLFADWLCKSTFRYAAVGCVLRGQTPTTTLPFGSVLADAPTSKNAKTTLVYQHELPNVPGRSVKDVFVEYDPGTTGRAHRIQSPPSSTRLCLRGRATVRSTRDRSRPTRTDITPPSAPATATTSVLMRARKLAKLLAVFVVDTNETKLTT